ncbi:MAG TPA: hypothetical protein PLQ81_01265 [bacterium]|nr:hypothetical protein [bacterium]
MWILIFSDALFSAPNQTDLKLKNLQIIYANGGYDSALAAAEELFNLTAGNAEKAELSEFCAGISFSNNRFEESEKYMKIYERLKGSLNSNLAVKKLSMLISKNRNSEYEKLIDYIFENLVSDFSGFQELTNILLQNGMLDRAVGLYNKAKIKFNNAAVFLPILINIYEAQDRYDSAIIEYKNYLITNPNYSYYFENFKTMLYSKKLFSEFLKSLNQNELKRFSEIPHFMPVIADAYFHSGNMDSAEKMYFEYFKSVKYDPRIIEDIIIKLTEAEQKSLSVKLLFGIIRNNEKFAESAPYKTNMFRFNVSDNQFFLFLLADNLDIINYDSEIVNLLASSLSAFPNDYFHKIACLIPENGGGSVYYFKYYFHSGMFDSAVESLKKINADNAELSYYAGLSNLYSGKFEAAKLYFEKIILNFGDSKFVPDSLAFYKFLTSNIHKNNYSAFLKINSQNALSQPECDVLLNSMSDKTLKTLSYISLMKKNSEWVFDMELEKIIEDRIFMPEALFLKSKFFISQKKKDESKKMLEKIITGYADSLYFSAAKKMLKEQLGGI